MRARFDNGRGELNRRGRGLKVASDEVDTLAQMGASLFKHLATHLEGGKIENVLLTYCSGDVWRAAELLLLNGFVSLEAMKLFFSPMASFC